MRIGKPKRIIEVEPTEMDAPPASPGKAKPDPATRESEGRPDKEKVPQEGKAHG